MGDAVSKLLVCGEKVSLCLVCTSLIWCLVLTMLSIMALSIGLGYNHCFTDIKSRSRYVPAHYKYDYSPRYIPGLQRMSDDFEKKKNDGEELEELLRGEDLRSNVESFYDPGGAGFANKTLTTRDFLRSIKIISSNTESVETVVNNNLDSETKINPQLRKSEEKIENTKNKELIPIAGLNLLDLLSKLKESGKNYSVQIIRH